jgi:beta-N-acetylhexosaminidase
MKRKIARRAADGLGVLLPGFEGTELPGWLRERLSDGLAGVCLFATNVATPARLRDLTDAIRSANPAAIIAIDEEGGDVTRLYYTEGSPFPGNAVLGRVDDLTLTSAVASSVGAALAGVGVNLDFAPDVDVNSNPLNPVIGVRSFGADPARVAQHSSAWVRGLQSAGVAACAKHFPGHGDTAQDSHLSLPVVEAPLAVLRERELVPFEAAIAAGALSIMTSHIVLPHLDDVPATLSSRVLTELLRGELGFEGVIVSDALDMHGASAETGVPEAAVRALIAGCDLLCIGTRNTEAQLREIASAIEARVPAARIADAAKRNRSLAQSLGRHPSADLRPEFDLAVTATAFDVRPGVVVSRERTIVALDTVVNLAIGVAPWGPRADLRLTEGDRLPATSGQLVLVGRDNHRHAWVRDIARSAPVGSLVIDMGWPDESREFADVATFGASRHVSSALEHWLERSAR